MEPDRAAALAELDRMFAIRLRREAVNGAVAMVLYCAAAVAFGEAWALLVPTGTALFVYRSRQLRVAGLRRATAQPDDVVWVHRYERGRSVFGLKLISAPPFSLGFRDGQRLFFGFPVPQAERFQTLAAIAWPAACQAWSPALEKQFRTDPTSLGRVDPDGGQVDPQIR